VAEDLTRFLNHEPVHARRISPVGRLWRFAQRHPSITIVSTAAAITVLAVTTVAYVKVLHGRDEAVKARDEAVQGGANGALAGGFGHPALEHAGPANERAGADQGSRRDEARAGAAGPAPG